MSESQQELGNTGDASAAPATQERVAIPGGCELEVEYRDGKRETVGIRQILVSQIQRYSLAISWQDEATAIELYCAKDKGWADTLTPESANAISEKGKEINSSFLEHWTRRQAEWRQIMAAAMGEEKSSSKADSTT